MTVLNIAPLYDNKEIIEELTHQMTKQATTQEPTASQGQSPAHEDVTISQVLYYRQRLYLLLSTLCMLEATFRLF